MRVLAIGNIESRGAALDLAGKEGKEYPRYSYKIGSNFGSNFINKRLELFQLFLYKRRAPETHRVIRL